MPALFFCHPKSVIGTPVVILPLRTDDIVNHGIVPFDVGQKVVQHPHPSHRDEIGPNDLESCHPNATPITPIGCKEVFDGFERTVCRRVQGGGRPDNPSADS